MEETLEFHKGRKVKTGGKCTFFVKFESIFELISCRGFYYVMKSYSKLSSKKSFVSMDIIELSVYVSIKDVSNQIFNEYEITLHCFEGLK